MNGSAALTVSTSATDPHQKPWFVSRNPRAKYAAIRRSWRSADGEAKGGKRGREGEEEEEWEGRAPPHQRQSRRPLAPITTCRRAAPITSCYAVRAGGVDAVREDEDDGESRTFDDAMDVTPRSYHSRTAAGTGRRTRRPALAAQLSSSGRSLPSSPSFPPPPSRIVPTTTIPTAAADVVRRDHRRRNDRHKRRRGGQPLPSSLS